MVIKMNFEYSEKDENFRKEVKDWLDETLPKSLSEKVKKYQRLTKEDYEIFMNNLTAKGWLAWHWPKEYGGTGWNAIEKHIFFARETLFEFVTTISINLRAPSPSITIFFAKSTIAFLSSL